MFALDTLSQVPLSTVAVFPALIPVSVDETCTVSDPFTAQAIFEGESFNSVTLTDEGPGTYNFFGYLEDSLVLNVDEAGAFNANPTVSESLTLPEEDIGSAFAFNRSVEDTITLIDAPTSNAIFANPSVDESTTLTDTPDVFKAQFANVDETMDTDTDAFNVQVDFVVQRNETLTTTDAEYSQTDFAPVVSETATITESLIESGWQRIDNRETSVWVQVNNNQ